MKIPRLFSPLRHLVLSLAMFSTALTLAHAQPSGDGEREAKRDKMRAKVQARIDAVAKELNLTNAQKAQAEPIKKKYRQEFEDLRNDQTLSREEKFAEGYELWQSALTEFRTILTADQNAKLDEIMESNREKRQARLEKWKQRRQQQDASDSVDGP
ncbi:MAG: hypothetical protein AAGK14_06620 [Verrucomicrobiota bacterium]